MKIEERGSYRHARQDHAFFLRCENVPLREIASRLGLASKEGARANAENAARRLNRALRHTKMVVTR